MTFMPLCWALSSPCAAGFRSMHFGWFKYSERTQDWRKNGKYTCFTWNGSSVVDYVITSNTAFDKILYFQVKDLIPFLSDHSALTYLINLKYTVDPKTDKNLHDIPPKYIWDLNATTNFLNILNNQEMKNIFCNETAKMMEVNVVNWTILTVDRF